MAGDRGRWKRLVERAEQIKYRGPTQPGTEGEKEKDTIKSILYIKQIRNYCCYDLPKHSLPFIIFTKKNMNSVYRKYWV